MIEPLTDQEFKEVKKNWESMSGLSTDWKITRLIATVESLKYGIDLERAKLEAVINGRDEGYRDLKEENAKLRVDVKTLQISMESLRKHGIKLKMQRDAALKRIEEMEVK